MMGDDCVRSIHTERKQRRFPFASPRHGRLRNWFYEVFLHEFISPDNGITTLFDNLHNA